MDLSRKVRIHIFNHLYDVVLGWLYFRGLHESFNQRLKLSKPIGRKHTNVAEVLGVQVLVFPGQTQKGLENIRAVL
jgi:hypothetical protein